MALMARCNTKDFTRKDISTIDGVDIGVKGEEFSESDSESRRDAEATVTRLNHVHLRTVNRGRSDANGLSCDKG